MSDRNSGRHTAALKRHKRIDLRLPVLLGWLIAAGADPVHAGDVHAILTRKDFAAETYARMLVVLTAASGQQALAECMHDRYFGSPLMLRRTLWEIWKHPSVQLEAALLDVTKATCSKKLPDLTESERQSWLLTGNESILLEPGKPATSSATDMIAAYERMRGEHSSAQCLSDESPREQADRIVSGRLRHEPRVPVTLAIYDAYRTLCGLNQTGPAASEIVLPAIPNVSAVARERLRIVRDFAICKSGGEANVDACVRQAYKTRSKGLFNQLLSSDSRN